MNETFRFEEPFYLSSLKKDHPEFFKNDIYLGDFLESDGWKSADKVLKSSIEEYFLVNELFLQAPPHPSRKI